MFTSQHSSHIYRYLGLEPFIEGTQVLPHAFLPQGLRYRIANPPPLARVAAFSISTTPNYYTLLLNSDHVTYALSVYFDSFCPYLTLYLEDAPCSYSHTSFSCFSLYSPHARHAMIFFFFYLII